MWPDLPVVLVLARAMMAASDRVFLLLRANSLDPPSSVDAIVAAAQVMTALQIWLAAQTSGSGGNIFANKGGNRYNIIANQVELEGTPDVKSSYSATSGKQVGCASFQVAAGLGQMRSALCPRLPGSINSGQGFELFCQAGEEVVGKQE